jgi:hypothetical protein
MTTTEELHRELADASNVIAALTAKLDRANARIARMEEAGDAMANVLVWSAGISYRRSPTALAWRKAKEAKL